jgi:tripartite-type tricarboxylate transporter receptor subunit TctC
MKKLLLLTCLLLVGHLAFAQGPITLLVPSTPGGAPDLVARLVGEALRTSLQTEVVVNNVPGANGELAVQKFMHASPESNTLLVTQDSVLVVNPHLYRRDVKAPWQVGQALAYLGHNDAYVLLRADHAANSLAELFKTPRSTEKPLFYGTGGVGSLAHLVAEDLHQASGSRLMHVPYKSNSEALAGLLRGEVELIISGSAALPMLRANRIKAIAVIGNERSKLFPLVPKASDTFPGVAFNPWFGVMAPTSAPPKFVAQVSAALQSALQEPQFQKTMLLQGGITVDYLAPQAFLQVLQKDYARYGRLVQRLGLQTDRP